MSAEQLEAAMKNSEAARWAPVVPTLKAEYYEGGLGGGTFSDGTGSYNTTREYGIGLTWRIGPGGLFDPSRTHLADARQRGTAIERDKLREEIARQVVEAYTLVHSLQDQLAHARAALGAAEKTSELARERRAFAVGEVLESILAEAGAFPRTARPPHDRDRAQPRAIPPAPRDRCGCRRIRAAEKIITRTVCGAAYRRAHENPFARTRALRGAGAHRRMGGGARAHAHPHGVLRRRSAACVRCVRPARHHGRADEHPRAPRSPVAAGGETFFSAKPSAHGSRSSASASARSSSRMCWAEKCSRIR